MEASALSAELKIQLKKRLLYNRMTVLFFFISENHLHIEIMVATRMPKVIIKDNASYVVIANTPNQGGTDHQESLTLYSTKVFVSLFLFRDVVKST